MSRRVSLPGADELFRATGPSGQDDAGLLREPTHDPAPPQSSPRAGATPEPESSDVGTRALTAVPEDLPRRGAPTAQTAPSALRGERRPTGRERHDEKITVYCSAAELLDIERARLTLRGEFGLPSDRGRIVREALAIVLAELEEKGPHSTLVRRLRGG